VFTVATFDHLASEQYLPFAEVNGPQKGLGYQISCEARVSGTFTNAAVGLQLIDSRGGDATHSGVPLEGMECATQWQPFSTLYHTYPDCPGALLCWRLRAKKDSPISGTLEIRNLKIGFIFQSFNLLPKLTALENVELPLIYRGERLKERREKSMQYLELVGLAERMNHRPSELSGGQQQRVAIARALAGGPPIILADEPTGALDSKSGKEVMAMMHQLNDRGHTIVLITHDLEIANQAKRIVRIHDGTIISDEKVGD
jgi:energy-coupling factor transporter ATP-binding protein EcfA2